MELYALPERFVLKPKDCPQDITVVPAVRMYKKMEVRYACNVASGLSNPKIP